MIRKYEKSDEKALLEFVSRDNARNYFIRLSLLKKKPSYKD